MMIMFYAKKIFDEAGVAYPKDDWTFDQFVEIAKKLTNADKRKFGYQMNGNWYRDIGWIVLAGKREFDNIIDPKKSQFGAPEIGADAPDHGLRHGAHLQGRAQPGRHLRRQHHQHGRLRHEVRRPVVPASAQHPGTARRRRRKWPSTSCACRRARARAGRIAAGAKASCVTKSDKAEAAWNFAAYLVSEEGNKMYSEITGRIPSNLALAESWWVPRTKELYGIENGKAFLDAFKEGQIDVVSGVPRSKMWAEVVKPTAWDVMNAGTAKAADVLPKVDDEAAEAARRVLEVAVMSVSHDKCQASVDEAAT